MLDIVSSHLLPIGRMKIGEMFQRKSSDRAIGVALTMVFRLSHALMTTKNRLSSNYNSEIFYRQQIRNVFTAILERNKLFSSVK